MNRVSYVLAYWFYPCGNPLTPNPPAKEQFKQLSLRKKVAVLFAVTIASLVTGTVATLASFRFFTRHLSALDKKVQAAAQKANLGTPPQSRKSSPTSPPAPISSPSPTAPTPPNALSPPLPPPLPKKTPPTTPTRTTPPGALQRSPSISEAVTTGSLSLRRSMAIFTETMKASSLPNALKLLPLQVFVEELITTSGEHGLRLGTRIYDAFKDMTSPERAMLDRLIQKTSSTETSARRRRLSINPSEPSGFPITATIREVVQSVKGKNSDPDAQGQVAALLAILTARKSDLQSTLRRLNLQHDTTTTPLMKRLEQKGETFSPPADDDDSWSDDGELPPEELHRFGVHSTEKKRPSSQPPSCHDEQADRQPRLGQEDGQLGNIRSASERLLRPPVPPRTPPRSKTPPPVPPRNSPSPDSRGSSPTVAVLRSKWGQAGHFRRPSQGP